MLAICRLFQYGSTLLCLYHVKIVPASDKGWHGGLGIRLLFQASSKQLYFQNVFTILWYIHKAEAGLISEDVI